MLETTFFFIRHGETEYNRRRIVQGRGVDAVLNETGRIQAGAVARRLASESLDVVYSSPLRRAKETAEAIAALHDGIPLRFLPDLEEMAWGVYEGAPPSAWVQKAFDEIRGRWRQGDFGYRIKGGESILDVQHRALRAMDHLLRHHEGERIAVVTHGRFLRVLLATLLEEYGLERMHEIEHANTAVNHLSCTAGRYKALRLNCTAHLRELLPERMRDEAA